MNSGATSRPGDDVHQTDMRNLDQPLADRVVERACAIRDDERTPGDRRLERRRAALAERRVGRAQHGERLRSHDRNGQRAGSSVMCGASAHDDLERRIAPLQLARGGDEVVEVPIDLLRRLPGKSASTRSFAPKPSALARRRAIGKRRQRDRAADARRTSRRCRACAAAPPRTAGSPRPS